MAVNDCPLTETEIEVLSLLSDGNTQVQIGDIRSTSKNTTRNMVNTIRLKLGSSNVTHSVAIALREGWIE